MDVPLALELTIRDHFLDDHRRLEGLFAKVVLAIENEGPEGASTFWAEFARATSHHLDSEEELLIARLLATRPREGRALLAEHHHLRARMVDLSVDFGRGSTRIRTARGFIEELRAHARHEDTVLYEWANQHLTQAECKALFEGLADRNADHVTT
jgi:hemerythrin-like domain-containing protein